MTAGHPSAPRLWCPECGHEAQDVEAWRALDGTVAYGHQGACDMCASTMPPVTSRPTEVSYVAYLLRAYEARAQRDAGITRGEP